MAEALRVISGKDLLEIAVSEMCLDHFAEDVAEVGRERQVAAFIQLLGSEAGPIAE